MNRRTQHPEHANQRDGHSVRVLSYGKIAELLFERNELLRAAGYKVAAARTTADATSLLEKPHQVIIFGHAVPEAERNLIAAAAKASYPAVKVIMLYVGTIHNAELADALLSARGSPEDLLRTIEHLLTANKSSAEAC